MRVRGVAAALCGVLVVGCTSPVSGTAVSTGQVRCKGGEVSVEAERSMDKAVPTRPRYVTNDKPTMDRSVSAGELSPQGKDEPKVLSDADFLGAWVRVFESGSDTLAKYRRETYSLYEFATADGACAHQRYVDGLEQAKSVKVDGVPEATEIDAGPLAGPEQTITLVATKGRFRVMIKTEAQGADLARYGGMDMLEQFYARVK